MGEKTKTNKVESFVLSVLEGTAFELVLCEFKNQGKEWFLRVFIDHPEGVTLDHCVDVNRMLSQALEERDPIEHAYRLEVSSPGVDRPLVKPEDFVRFQGERIFVKLHMALEGRKTFTGKLTSCTEEQLEIIHEENQACYKIPLDAIAKATLKPVLDFS